MCQQPFRFGDGFRRIARDEGGEKLIQPLSVRVTFLTIFARFLVMNSTILTNLSGRSLFVHHSRRQ